MKKLAVTAFYLAPLVLAVCLFMAGPSWSQAVPAAHNPKIGVVNINTVFNNSQKIKLYRDGMQQTKDSEQKKIETLKAKMDAASAELDAIKAQLKQTPGSNELKLKLREKSAELASSKSEYEFRVNSWNEFIENDISSKITSLYKDISLSIGNYASANGYDIILKIDDDPNQSNSIFNDDRIERRNVLYFKEYYDITGEILKELDKK